MNKKILAFSSPSVTYKRVPLTESISPSSGNVKSSLIEKVINNKTIEKIIMTIKTYESFRA